METIGKRVEKLTLRGAWVALLMIVAMGLFASSALAQGPGVPATTPTTSNVVLSAPVSFYTAGAWPGGGMLAGGEPAGTSWGINSMGTIVASSTYGKDVVQFTGGPSAYAISVAGPYGSGNTGGVAIDPSNNLWVGGIYSNTIVKVPMSSTGTYTVTDATASGASVPNCTGTASDASGECVIQALTVSALGYFGVEAMAFDSSGDLFFVTDGQGSEPYSIYECTASCLYGSSPTAPQLIWNEPTLSSNQYWIGDIALDSAGNIFFTDSSQVNASNEESAVSDVYVLTASSGYAAPIAIATDTVPTASQGSYDEQIVSVAVVSGSTTDTVYYGSTDGGIFAATVNASTGAASGIYGVANGTGVKGIIPDGNGNFYVDAYNGADTLGLVAVTNLSDPTITGAGQSTTFQLNASDNGSAACGAATPPSLTLAVSGTDASAFDATAPALGSCGTQLLGTTFPITVTFTPTAVGSDTATLTATDSSTSATGTANLSGTALKKQVIGFAPATPVTWASGLTIALSATEGASGEPVTFTMAASSIATLSDDTVTVTAPGTISVTANEVGNSTYAPAPAVTKSIVISPIPQTITWAPAPPRNVTTAASPITLTATSATSTASGEPVVFSVDSSSTCTGASLNSATLTFSSVTAPCTIVVDANEAASSNGDYAAATQIQATILVTSAVLPTGAPVILSQSTFLSAFSAGGATSSSNPDGGTMTFDPNGDVLVGATYGGDILSFNINSTSTGNQSILVSGYSNQTGAVAVDASGNLFVGDTYGGAPYIVKIPWNSTTKAYATYSAAPTTDCTGTDSVPCLMSYVTAGSAYPIQALAFDSAGDLFYSVQTDNGTAGTQGITYEGSIWECTAACLYTGSPAPVMLTQEPTVNDSVTPTTDTATTALSPTTAVAQILGGLAVDSKGDLFFTDTAEDNQSLIHYTDLYELPYSSSSGYPTIPTTLVTEIVNPPAQYPSEIDTVSIDPTSGDVYFSDQAAVYAFANTPGTPLSPSNVQATMWTVSPQGGKYIAAAGNGVLYVADYSGAASGDSMYYTTIGAVNVPGIVPVGQSGTVPGTAVIGSSTTPVTQMYTVLNDGNCTNPETVAFTSTASEFSAALTTSGSPAAATCNSTFTDGTWFATTLTFTPVSGDKNGISGTLTATDSSSNTGTAAVTGTAPNLTSQTITITNPSTPTSTVTFGVAPITLTATATSSLAVTFTLDPSTTGYTNSTTSSVATLSGSTLTITGYGTVVIDANQAGNGTYAAAPQVQATITVSAAGTVAAPTISPASGTQLYSGVNNTVSITDATPGATIYFTTDGSTPTVSSSSCTGTCQVTLTLPPQATSQSFTVNAIAVAPGYLPNTTVTTATYTVSSLQPNYTATVSPSAVDLAPGSSAIVDVTIAPNAAFLGTISFSCTGAPSGVSCAFSPATLTASSTNNITTVLTITDAATTSANRRGPNPFIPGGATFALALGFLGFRKRRGLVLGLVLLAGIFGLTQLTGCGSSSGNSSTGSTTSTMNVTATSTYAGQTITQTLPITITIRK